MRPSEGVSIGLMQTLLARPPRLVDVVNAALRGLDLSLEEVLQQRGSRLRLAELREAKTYEDFDLRVRAIVESEIEEVARFLPQGYLAFARTFFELGGLERFCLARAGPGATDAGREGAEGPFPQTCDSGTVEAFYITYLKRVNTSLAEVREDQTWVREFVKSLVALHYYRYLRNAEALKLGANNFEKFVKSLGLNPTSELLLRRAVGSLSRIDGAELSRYTVHEAAEALSMATHILLHRGGLVNLLTLFLATKYYEPKVLRYVFLPKALRRW